MPKAIDDSSMWQCCCSSNWGSGCTKSGVSDEVSSWDIPKANKDALGHTRIRITEVKLTYAGFNARRSTPDCGIPYVIGANSSHVKLRRTDVLLTCTGSSALSSVPGRGSPNIDNVLPRQASALVSSGMSMCTKFDMSGNRPSQGRLKARMDDLGHQ